MRLLEFLFDSYREQSINKDKHEEPGVKFEIKQSIITDKKTTGHLFVEIDMLKARISELEANQIPGSCKECNHSAIDVHGHKCEATGIYVEDDEFCARFYKREDDE